MFGALKRGFRGMASLILVRNVVGELQKKEHLRHHAVSLRQHGFLVLLSTYCEFHLQQEPTGPTAWGWTVRCGRPPLLLQSCRKLEFRLSAL